MSSLCFFTQYISSADLDKTHHPSGFSLMMKSIEPTSIRFFSGGVFSWSLLEKFISRVLLSCLSFIGLGLHFLNHAHALPFTPSIACSAIPTASTKFSHICLALNSALFMYVRVMAFSLCSVLYGIRRGFGRMVCGIEHERQALKKIKSVKPSAVEWCGQRGRNGFTVSEHCLGRSQNPEGLGFTYFIFFGYSPAADFQRGGVAFGGVFRGA